MTARIKNPLTLFTLTLLSTNSALAHSDHSAIADQSILAQISHSLLSPDHLVATLLFSTGAVLTLSALTRTFKKNHKTD